MSKLSIDDVISKIKNEETFSTSVEDRSFSITIDEYVPFVCTAIHNGGNLRKELKEKSI